MFESMGDVKRANRAAGQYWFSPDTMRFFDCRLETTLRHGCLFVSSERREGDSRRYTVRLVTPDASIDTVGEFQEHATKAQALKALEAYAATIAEGVS